jgi:hypothetical protein
VPTMRKRSRSASSLKKRLLKFAEEVRAAAKFIAPGPEQDQLLRKALKAETLANTVDRKALVDDLATHRLGCRWQQYGVSD